VKWFKHDTDASTDARVKKLILRYGTNGYAIYFHCLELIAGDISETNITFELEHDAEIIADNLKVQGTASQSAIDLVNEIMRYIVDLGLFEEQNSQIFCFKMLKRLDSSMTSNPLFRKMIGEARQSHDGVMMESCPSHDPVMPEETRLEENRIEEKDAPKQKEVKHKHGENGKVMLSDERYTALEAELGHDVLEAAIDLLDNYKYTSGNTYKQDDGAIKKWVLKQLRQDRPELFRKSTATPTKELDADILAVVQRANGGSK